MRTRDEIMEHFGWKRCYHREAEWHFNVKLNGVGRWNGWRETIAKLAPNADSDMLQHIAESIEDDDREFWWLDWLPQIVEGAAGYPVERIYGCGRSGGYVNVARLESNLEAMGRLAEVLASEREYWNSAEAGQYLAERAAAEYVDQRLAELASPRPERVEA